MRLPHRGTLARELAMIVLGAIAVALAVLAATFLLSGALTARAALADRLVWMGGGLLLFTLGVSIICSFILQRHIAGPIRQLLDAMRAVTAEQKYEVRVSLHSSEEINARRGRGRQWRQERLSRQHESRDPHAHERCHRDD